MKSEIVENLKQLYISDPRPWIIGYSGGKDSTMLVSLIFETIQKIYEAERQKEVAVVCTDTRIEIPAVVDRVENELTLMQEFSQKNNLKISAHLLKPPAEQSFWVNIIGRGYPPPNRTFRWCTQRLKINPVSEFIRTNLNRWGEAIIHLGARRSESGSRSQTMKNRARNDYGLSRHDDLPRCWIATPIEFVTTDEVWEYLLDDEKDLKTPWGGDNRTLFNLYKDASGGECPLVVDKSTPSCGNSRFGCWTCTVVERDKASEGLLASGDERMKELLNFRDTLIEYRDPENGYRDLIRKNGQDGPGPLKIKACKQLLELLLELQNNTKIKVISDEELHWIQTLWKSMRNPDNGDGVANIITQQQGATMPVNDDSSYLRSIEQEVAEEKGISLNTLQRLIGKVEEYGESHRALGLQEDLLQILQDDLRTRTEESDDVNC
jgi:DNA sulfur modification protein DndC